MIHPYILWRKKSYIFSKYVKNVLSNIQYIKTAQMFLFVIFLLYIVMLNERYVNLSEEEKEK